jgi:hypothetical protein
MSVRKTEKTSGNRRLKENRQLQSQMIGHGVESTFEAAVGVQWMGEALRGSVPVKCIGRRCRLCWRVRCVVGVEVSQWEQYCIHGCDVGAVMSFADQPTRESCTRAMPPR